MGPISAVGKVVLEEYAGIEYGGLPVKYAVFIR
jgi:hypothetical protein